MDIILIEENPKDAELIIRALGKYSLADKLTHLKSGQEALDFFLRKPGAPGVFSPHLPKLILLSNILSDTGSMQILQAIKTDETLQMIPVVMLSESADQQHVRECYKNGANSFVVKPAAFSDFLAAVSELGLYWLLLNKPAGVPSSPVDI